MTSVHRARVATPATALIAVGVSLLAFGCVSPACPQGYRRSGDRCVSAQDSGVDAGGAEPDGGAESCVPSPERCDGTDEDCDGVDDARDADAHSWCGDPTRAPNATARCGGSACEVVECVGPYLDCSAAPGCESDPASSREHCGECGRACGWTCVDAECDDVVQLAGGFDFHCALRTSGDVYCWGKNQFGRLGDGTTTARSRPTPVVDLRDAVEIRAGQDHACARRADNSVWCWGMNVQRQLGNATDDRYATRPVEVLSRDAGAQEIAAGGFHTCARLSTGRVVCWGDNNDGQSGSGVFHTDQSDPTDVGVSDAIAIAAGGYHSCALRSNAEIVCWGNNRVGQLGDDTTADRSSATGGTPVIGLRARAIAAGALFTCAITLDDEVACWGDNYHGQLGVGGRTDLTRPWAPFLLAGVNELSVGNDHTCARVSSDLFCWGRSDSGQTGTPGVDWLEPPNAPMLTGVVEVRASNRNTCARLTSGEVVCWGDNSFGQVGDGTVSATPREAPGAPVLPPE